MQNFALLSLCLLYFSEHYLVSSAVAVRKALVTTRRPPTTKSNIAEDVKAKEQFEKYYECQLKCKDKGEKLVCGENGWWFHNNCHRECEGVKASPTAKECDPYEKAEFEHYYVCQTKCKGQPIKQECGVDGGWYQNACKRECYNMQKIDKSYCERLDKVAECAERCLNKGTKITCGVDANWYDNQCHLDCSGVKAGVEGKDCESRTNLTKYWSCQEKCRDKEKKEECGTEGYYFYNTCHRECFGSKLGVLGKDCKE